MNTYFLGSLLIPFIICVFIGIRASNMGYSGLLWFFISFLYVPLGSLYLLTGLPDRNIEKKREEEMILLKEQFSKSTFSRREGSSPISDDTINDDTTIG